MSRIFAMLLPKFAPTSLTAALCIVPLLTACATDDAESDDAAASDTAGSSGSTGPSAETSTTSPQGSDDAASTTEDADGTTSDGSNDTTVDGTSSGACVEPGGDPVQDAITLTTADGKSISGIVTRPSTGSCLPAALLLHQFSNTKSQWDAHLATFIERGYVTLAIDLRGHGESDPQDGAFNDLLTDPDQAPLDVQAALEHLQGHQAVDTSRIAVVGTSIGANLAVVAASQDLGVRATVAISTRLTPVQSLLGGAQIAVGPLLCYAGETDGGGDQAMTCGALEPLSSGPADSVILPGSSAHGVTIVDTFPETIPSILDFLDANL
ncbi:MAG: alpha/beta fold hydrolase [Nannocystaceae bacterium]|nr:alpha/beta fold hydrolase [Nannocystaceae bacterium]